MKDLHLKYHCETGIVATTDLFRDDEDEYVELATPEYVEWLEDLAEKYLKKDLSLFSNSEIKEELDRRVIIYLKEVKLILNSNAQ